MIQGFGRVAAIICAMKTILAPIFLMAAFCCPAVAGNCLPEVRDGWIRPGPAAMPMMAGFGRIENHCPAPATIVSIGSVAFGETMLHETKVVDGVSRMRHLPQLRIAPDGVATLKPGGMHLMLMRPAAQLKEGSKVAIEFSLSDGRKVLGEFVVRSPTAL